MISKNFNEIEIMTKNKYSAIHKVFKSLNGYLKISHMAVIVVTPDKKIFLASSSTQFTETFFKLGYHCYDNTLCPVMYENLDFYNWTEGYIKKHQKEIFDFKIKFKLYNGSVFVRRIAEFTILYTVATNILDPVMKTLFINNSNKILELGDYFYNELNDSFVEASHGFKLPKIRVFKPFLQNDIRQEQNENIDRKKILNILQNNLANYIKLKNYNKDENHRNKIIVLNRSNYNKN